jgi:transposase-like protein
MGRVSTPKLKPKKVSTPGTYRLEARKKSGDGGGNRKKDDRDGKKGGSGGSGGKKRARKKKGMARKDNYRTRYTKEDMEMAVKLVREEGYSVAQAAKTAGVPRMTLNDRINKPDPDKVPKVGRPQELSPVEEEAIVKCLCMCAEFQYPMRKRDLQLFVQDYVVENSIETRWEDGKPGKEWVRYFRKRWAHKVKVKKPTNIKRSRAMVSPAILKKFFHHLAPNIEGVPATHIFNYDETNLRDDPGKVPTVPSVLLL